MFSASFTPRIARFSFTASLLGIVLVACTVNPSAQEVVDKAAPAICEKTKECNGELLFNTAYPGGIDECVTKTKDSMKKQYGDDLERKSKCSDDEVDKCINDIKGEACPAQRGDPLAVPCDC